MLREGKQSLDHPWARVSRPGITPVQFRHPHPRECAQLTRPPQLLQSLLAIDVEFLIDI